MTRPMRPEKGAIALANITKSTNLTKRIIIILTLQTKICVHAPFWYACKALTSSSDMLEFRITLTQN